MAIGARGSETGASDEDRALHARLLRKEPLAKSDLAVQHLGPLVASLQGRFPRIDDALLETIAIELVLKTGEEPEKYNPDRLSLSAYLLMAAKGDVLNALRSEKTRTQKFPQIPLHDVELSLSARNSQWMTAADPADSAIEALDRGRLDLLRAQFNDQDWEIVQLLCDGE